MRRLILATVTAVLLAAGLATACSSTATPSGNAQITPAADHDKGYMVSVPAIGVTASPLEPVGLNPDHTIVTPPVTAPQQAAVYTGAPMPGQVGPAVILGHINGGGKPGVFSKLAQVKTGDTVQTTAPDGTLTVFSVYRTAVVDKTSFPTAQVYSDTPGPELRLVSCGGQLDRSAHSYVGQVIVWAKKV